MSNRFINLFDFRMGFGGGMPVQQMQQNNAREHQMVMQIHPSQQMVSASLR